MAWAQLNETDTFEPNENGVLAPIAIYRQSYRITYINEDGNAVPSPRDWFTEWTIEQKNAAHIFAFEENVIDPNVEMAAGEPQYAFNGTTVTAITPTQDLTLDGYKAIKMRELDGDYERAIVAPVIVDIRGNDYAFSTEPKPKSLMYHLRTGFNTGLTFPPNFKWSSIAFQTFDVDGNVIEDYPQIVATIDEPEFNSIVQAVLTQDYTSNLKFITLREDVENATTRAEVEAITWS